MASELKQQISDKLLELVAHGGADKITVRKLAKECHITRQTFYYHFNDIFSAIEWSLQQKMISAARECAEIACRQQSIELFAGKVAAHLYLVRHFLNAKHRAEMEKILLQGVFSFVEYIIKHTEDYAPLSDEDRAFILEFFSCGIMQYMVEKSAAGSFDVKIFSRQMDALIRGRINEAKSLLHFD